MDIQAKLAELRKKKQEEANQNQEIQNAQSQVAEIKTADVAVPVSRVHLENNNNQNKEVSVPKTETNSLEQTNQKANSVVQTIGTARTSEIDHMDFMSKMQELQEAIHHQHPKMPVLLMMIHKQLRNDPELVTTLSEEEIGVIVNGLKIQTKTELVGTVAKQAKSRDKKTALSSDMF